MPRNAIPAPLLLDGFAFSATAPSLLGHVGISWRKLMSRWAVSFSSLASAIGRPTKGKPLNVSKVIWADNVIIRKTSRNSLHNSIDFQSIYLSQGSGHIRNPADGYAPRNTPVALLLFPGSPPTVARLIVPIIVDAFNAISVRTRPHVLDKQSERIPPLTDRDAPASIIVPRLKIWISATATHALPNYIKRVMDFEWHKHLSIRQLLVMQPEV